MLDKILTFFKKKKVSTKHQNSFEMQKVWLSIIIFNPVANESLDVKFIEANISKLYVDNDGDINITTDAIYRKYENSSNNEYYCGILGQIDIFTTKSLLGIFISKQDAIDATNKLVNKWRDDIIKCINETFETQH